MDSWSFNSVVKAFPYDESFSTTDAFDKDQIGSMGWEVKPSIIVRNNMGLFPNEINIENQVFGDIGFPPMKNPLFNPAMAASQNAISQDNESSPKLESNSCELFDPKLRRLTDQVEAPLFNASKTAHNLSRSEVSTPQKRPRGSGSPTPFCKVHGCNKNLSNCKEYHIRHKVCEVHSKTSRVIVNGIEQRFCQQCSRFHLLREFDDGKRSCRKRLAGHNERRRKPHAGVLFERHGKLLPYYNIGVEGKEFNRSTRAISSFPVPEDLHSLYQQKYATRNSWQMNLDDRTAHDLQSVSCVTDHQIQMHPKSLCPCNLKRNPKFDGYIGPTTSSSGSALSLLSYQSQSTCNSSRIQTPNSQSNPVWFPGSHCEQTQDSQPLHQHDMNPLVGLEGSSSFKFAIDEMFKGSKCRNVSEDLVFPNEECTIDLVQLSSRLEILEHQKRSSEVNHAHKLHFCKEKSCSSHGGFRI